MVRTVRKVARRVIRASREVGGAGTADDAGTGATTRGRRRKRTVQKVPLVIDVERSINGNTLSSRATEEDDAVSRAEKTESISGEIALSGRNGRQKRDEVVAVKVTAMNVSAESIQFHSCGKAEDMTATDNGGAANIKATNIAVLSGSYEEPEINTVAVVVDQLGIIDARESCKDTYTVNQRRRTTVTMSARSKKDVNFRAKCAAKKIDLKDSSQDAVTLNENKENMMNKCKNEINGRTKSDNYPSRDESNHTTFLKQFIDKSNCSMRSTSNSSKSKNRVEHPNQQVSLSPPIVVKWNDNPSGACSNRDGAVSVLPSCTNTVAGGVRLRLPLLPPSQTVINAPRRYSRRIRQRSSVLMKTGHTSSTTVRTGHMSLTTLSVEKKNSLSQSKRKKSSANVAKDNLVNKNDGSRTMPHEEDKVARKAVHQFHDNAAQGNTVSSSNSTQLLQRSQCRSRVQGQAETVSRKINDGHPFSEKLCAEEIEVSTNREGDEKSFQSKQRDDFNTAAHYSHSLLSEDVLHLLMEAHVAIESPLENAKKGVPVHSLLSAVASASSSPSSSISIVPALLYENRQILASVARNCLKHLATASSCNTDVESNMYHLLMAIHCVRALPLEREDIRSEINLLYHAAFNASKRKEWIVHIAAIFNRLRFILLGRGRKAGYQRGWNLPQMQGSSNIDMATIKIVAGTLLHVSNALLLHKSQYSDDSHFHPYYDGAYGEEVRQLVQQIKSSSPETLYMIIVWDLARPWIFMADPAYASRLHRNLSRSYILQENQNPGKGLRLRAIAAGVLVDVDLVCTAALRGLGLHDQQIATMMPPAGFWDYKEDLDFFLTEVDRILQKLVDNVSPSHPPLVYAEYCARRMVHLYQISSSFSVEQLSAVQSIVNSCRCIGDVSGSLALAAMASVLSCVIDESNLSNSNILSESAPLSQVVAPLHSIIIHASTEELERLWRILSRSEVPCIAQRLLLQDTSSVKALKYCALVLRWTYCPLAFSLSQKIEGNTTRSNKLIGMTLCGYGQVLGLYDAHLEKEAKRNKQKITEKDVMKVMEIMWQMMENVSSRLGEGCMKELWEMGGKSLEVLGRRQNRRKNYYLSCRSLAYSLSFFSRCSPDKLDHRRISFLASVLEEQKELSFSFTIAAMYAAAYYRALPHNVNVMDLISNEVTSKGMEGHPILDHARRILDKYVLCCGHTSVGDVCTEDGFLEIFRVTGCKLLAVVESAVNWSLFQVDDMLRLLLLQWSSNKGAKDNNISMNLLVSTVMMLVRSLSNLSLRRSSSVTDLSSLKGDIQFLLDEVSSTSSTSEASKDDCAALKMVAANIIQMGVVRVDSFSSEGHEEINCMATKWRREARAELKGDIKGSRNDGMSMMLRAFIAIIDAEMEWENLFNHYVPSTSSEEDVAIAYRTALDMTTVAAIHNDCNNSHHGCLLMVLFRLHDYFVYEGDTVRTIRTVMLVARLSPSLSSPMTQWTHCKVAEALMSVELYDACYKFLEESNDDCITERVYSSDDSLDHHFTSEMEKKVIRAYLSISCHKTDLFMEDGVHAIEVVKKVLEELSCVSRVEHNTRKLDNEKEYDNEILSYQLQQVQWIRVTCLLALAEAEKRDGKNQAAISRYTDAIFHIRSTLACPAPKSSIVVFLRAWKSRLASCFISLAQLHSAGGCRRKSLRYIAATADILGLEREVRLPLPLLLLSVESKAVHNRGLLAHHTYRRVSVECHIVAGRYQLEQDEREALLAVAQHGREQNHCPDGVNENLSSVSFFDWEIEGINQDILNTDIFKQYMLLENERYDFKILDHASKVLQAFLHFSPLHINKKLLNLTESASLSHQSNRYLKRHCCSNNIQHPERNQLPTIQYEIMYRRARHLETQRLSSKNYHRDSNRCDVDSDISVNAIQDLYDTIRRATDGSSALLRAKACYRLGRIQLDVAQQNGQLQHLWAGHHDVCSCGCCSNQNSTPDFCVCPAEDKHLLRAKLYFEAAMKHCGGGSGRLFRHILRYLALTIGPCSGGQDNEKSSEVHDPDLTFSYLLHRSIGGSARHRIFSSYRESCFFGEKVGGNYGGTSQRQSTQINNDKSFFRHNLFALLDQDQSNFVNTLQNFSNLIPATWAIVAMTVCPTGEVIGSRITSERVKRSNNQSFQPHIIRSVPFCIFPRRDFKGNMSMCQNCDILQKVVVPFDHIIERNKAQLKGLGSSVTSACGENEKRKWWAEREKLDSEIKAILEHLEEMYFGPHLLRLLKPVTSKLEMTQSKHCLPKVQNLQESLDSSDDQEESSVEDFELCKGFSNLDSKFEAACSIEDASNPKSTISSLLGSPKFTTMLHDSDDNESYDSGQSPNKTTTDGSCESYLTLSKDSDFSVFQEFIFVLDENLHRIPWESLSCLAQSVVCRVPSLPFALVRTCCFQMEFIHDLFSHACDINIICGNYKLKKVSFAG
mmetsp:Transcript_4690/g.9197  ORF Transcript_4690/g.9197 Transcript_4690/m.9197 type:complete len:2427 (-) Transcript_4690:771-8051(-)